MNDQLIQSITTASTALITSAWMAFILALLWYAYVFNKRTQHIITKLFVWSSLIACLLAISITCIHFFFLSAGYNDKISNLLNDNIEMLVNIMNWTEFISTIALFITSGTFTCYVIQEKRHITSTLADETADAPT